MADTPEEFVYVMGPEDGGVPGRVTRQAYDMIWAGRGYRIVEEGEVGDSPPTQAELDAASPTTTSKKKGA